MAFRKHFFLFCTLFFVLIKSNARDVKALHPIVGRWDITVDGKGKPQPSWMGIWLSGNSTLVGEFVGSGGSARPISKVYENNDSFSFAIPPQWDGGTNNMVVQGIVQGDKVSGTILFPNGTQSNFTAVRAPSLQRTKAPVWGKSVKIFNGKDVTGWHATGNNQWIVENGVLKSPHSGSNLVSDNSYTDFKLHIEFRYPEESNSGVYLRGRYEVQIEDRDTMYSELDHIGAIYGFIAPSEKVAKAANEWQSFDITLVGRMVTVALNGVTIICNREIPGITGGALDSDEGKPGPLQFQGDHGPIEFRNITIVTAQ